MRYTEFAVAAVAAALVGSLAGCSGNSKDGTTTASSTTAAPSTTTAAPPSKPVQPPVPPVTRPVPPPVTTTNPPVQPTKPPVVPTTQPVVPTTQPVTGPQPVYCGAGFNGLAIVAITTQGSAACSTATSVTNEYAAHSADWGPGFSVAVTADDGSVWTCQEQLGDPNPYQECVNQQNPAEKVRLSS